MKDLPNFLENKVFYNPDKKLVTVSETAMHYIIEEIKGAYADTPINSLKFKKQLTVSQHTHNCYDMIMVVNTLKPYRFTFHKSYFREL